MSGALRACRYTWGRSDMGQTAHGVEQSNATPQTVEALRDRDIVHAAGSSFNSAFVTRARLGLAAHAAPCKTSSDVEPCVHSTTRQHVGAVGSAQYGERMQQG